jgi:transposase
MKYSHYISQLEEHILFLIYENQSLEEENDNLKKRLLAYENPHTPPSLQQFKKKKDDSDDKKKLGAPKGHKGVTREKPIPEEKITVIADHCESCGSGHIKITDKKTNTIIEDLPPPGKIQVIEYERYQVECYECGHKSYSKHKDCPQEGNFGVLLLLYMVMLKFHLRGPIRKVREYLKHAHSFIISPKGILDSLNRVGNACNKEYDRVLIKIRNSKWCHIDETSFTVNKDKWWLWIFRSDQNDVLFVIRKSRGSKVVKEILGDDWDKPIISDGWSAYTYIPIVQRCWAHLIREVDADKDFSEKGYEMSEKVHSVFNNLKKILDNEVDLNERIKQKEILESRVSEIINEYKPYNELKKPLTYLENGQGKWFTCLQYPGMEPTNNLAEQTLRESVIYRKIIGAFRSEEGSQNYQYISSLLASWILQGKNIWEELETLLRQELCLS